MILAASAADGACGKPGTLTTPRYADGHLVDTGNGTAFFRVDTTQLFEIDQSLAEQLELCLAFDDPGRARALIVAAGLERDVPVRIPAPRSVPVKTLSLAIAQKCNLGCTYCYAQQGTFGGPAKSMPLPVAKSAVNRLIEGSTPGDRLTLVFMGGEPLANRSGLREATHYAAGKAEDAGVQIDFALTTNATLIGPDDVEFFERYRFSVTVSIDGIGASHDRLRPFRSGKGSYERVMERASLLLSQTVRRTRLNARVTVTPDNLDLRRTLSTLAEIGFDGIQFSPMLDSPAGKGEMHTGALEEMLAQMIECGKTVEAQLHRGKWYPFTNFFGALKRIHMGARDDYPCGAGGSYFGVSSDGGLYACHRFVDDETGRLGDVLNGVDESRRAKWLTDRHVDRQQPCITCWARRLCSGSCHYEAMHTGRPACDYIRGWLHYCLGAYVRLCKTCPDTLRIILGDPIPRGA